MERPNEPFPIAPFFAHVMSTPQSIRFRLSTLIGYGYTPQQISDMGLERRGETVPLQIAHDCDGEFQQQIGRTGRERLYPGYVGLSGLLSSPNAIVIPGILYKQAS